MCIEMKCKRTIGDDFRKKEHMSVVLSSFSVV